MQRWTVGDVELVRVVDDEVALPLDDPLPAWCVPGFTASTGELPVAFSALALRAGDGTRIVVDPWLANDAARTRADAGERSDRLLGALADAGFPADEVDVVVLSHFDGIGWTTRPGAPAAGSGQTGAPDATWRPSFPRARYLVPRTQLDAWATGLSPGHEGFAVIADAGLAEPVDPPCAVAPGVTVVPLPGHGPGHAGVRVDAGGDLAVYAGHLFVYLTQVVDPALPSDEDPAVAEATRRALLAELADRHGLLLSTLVGGAGGGRVEADGPGAWRLVR